MDLPQLAPWLALGAGVVVLAVAPWWGWRTWRAWQRVRLTRDAAVALLDVHHCRLDAAIALASEHVGRMADGGEQLAASLAELRADTAHLRWMLGRIPEERDRLRRELFDVLLPTGARADGD